jgi:hypothetical protein
MQDGDLEPLELPPGPDGCSARKALVVLLDGVRFDCLPQASTPALDLLAAGGFLAPDADLRNRRRTHPERPGDQLANELNVSSAPGCGYGTDTVAWSATHG